MEQFKSYPAPFAANASSAIATLNCLAPAAVDPAPVKLLLLEKSESDAEEIICRVLEDIARRLEALHIAIAVQNLSKLVEQARRIVQVAEQLGLTEVATVARHLIGQQDNGDGVTMSALMARFERAFDAAVTEVWQFNN